MLQDSFPIIVPSRKKAPDTMTCKCMYVCGMIGYIMICHGMCMHVYAWVVYYDVACAMF